MYGLDKVKKELVIYGLMDERYRPNLDYFRTQDFDPIPVVLEELVARQVSRFIALGFHQELGKTEDKYREDFSLPEELTNLGEYKRTQGLPLVVDPRVPLGKQHRSVNMVEYIDLEEVSEETPAPSKPYLLWVNVEENNPPTTAEIINGFSGDKIGATHHELISFYLNYPRMFIDHGIAAGGARYKGDIPFIQRFIGVFGVSRGQLEDRFPSWRVMSRNGRVIELGN